MPPQAMCCMHVAVEALQAPLTTTLPAGGGAGAAAQASGSSASSTPAGEVPAQHLAAGLHPLRLLAHAARSRHELASPLRRCAEGRAKRGAVRRRPPGFSTTQRQPGEGQLLQVSLQVRHAWDVLAAADAAAEPGTQQGAACLVLEHLLGGAHWVHQARAGLHQHTGKAGPECLAWPRVAEGSRDAMPDVLRRCSDDARGPVSNLALRAPCEALCVPAEHPAQRAEARPCGWPPHASRRDP